MFMDATKKITALFDCDGVIVDTEGQYTVFWNEMGQKYVNDANFGSKVKGQTLVQIYDKYFAGEPEKQRDITEALNRFEIKMNYDYVPGIVGNYEFTRSHCRQGRLCNRRFQRDDLRKTADYNFTLYLIRKIE